MKSVAEAWEDALAAALVDMRRIAAVHIQDSLGSHRKPAADTAIAAAEHMQGSGKGILAEVADPAVLQRLYADCQESSLYSAAAGEQLHQLSYSAYMVIVLVADSDHHAELAYHSLVRHWACFLDIEVGRIAVHQRRMQARQATYSLRKRLAAGPGC